MITVYGIKNCDSVKKARKWLTENNLDYQFHDFRSDGINEELIQSFIAYDGWEKLLNKRSTSWKQLDAADKENITEEKVIVLFLATPTLIKRPVLVAEKHFFIGFNAENYQTLL
ncbi:MAG: ArsC family reductase [Methyloprofundus sp.]|nr:ArsC family reductase [Methyloprofundus sp.]